MGSYIRLQEQPPFGFKLSETRAKTNGPSLDHLAPAGHTDVDSRQFTRYFRTARVEASFFSCYQIYPISEKFLALREIKIWKGIHFCDYYLFQFTENYILKRIKISLLRINRGDLYIVNELSVLPDLILDKSPRHVVTDCSGDCCMNWHGEYSEVHICVIQRRQQKVRHPIRYNPE